MRPDHEGTPAGSGANAPQPASGGGGSGPVATVSTPIAEASPASPAPAAAPVRERDDKTGSLGTIRALLAWLAASRGFRRLFVAALAGAGSSLAFAPVYAVPLLIPAFYVLLAILPVPVSERRANWTAFGVGFAFGFGHFLAGLYWITFAFLVNAERFGSLAPIALVMLAGVLAVFVGFVTLFTHRSGAQGLTRVLIFAGFWVVAEYARGLVLTGFPWNLVGYAWADLLPVAQGASVIGVYGLSLLTVLGCAATYAAFPAHAGGRPKIGGLLGLLVGFGALGGIGVWGADRIPDQPTPAVETVRLRLVQPSIDQSLKWHRNLRDLHFANYIELTRAPGYGTITHVVWPETALPFFLAGDAARLALVGDIAPESGLVLTGAPRRSEADDGTVRIYNSLHAVDETGTIIETYDKAHLVPFGEYVPYRSVLPLDWLNVGGGGFSPGPGLRTLDLPGLPPFSPLICYEIIFPGAVTAEGLRPVVLRTLLASVFSDTGNSSPIRPKWLLNLTNDAWFGASFGPHQHLAIARLRGIEEGLPVIRSANTGISVAFDPYGRELGRIGIGVRGILDTDLPQPTEQPTLYSEWGNALPLGGAVILLALGFLMLRVGGRISATTSDVDSGTA